MACSINHTLVRDTGGLFLLEVIVLGVDRAHQRITWNFTELHNIPLEQVSIIISIFSYKKFDILVYHMACSVFLS